MPPCRGHPYKRAVHRLTRLRPANRTGRIVVASLALVLVAVATAVAAPADRGAQPVAPLAASHAPGGEDDPPPTGEELAHAVDRLANAGISTDAETLAALAADHGLGGAIRLLAWADASGRSTGELAEMRADGMGWGQMAKELDGAHPGIGWIMGNGGGHGRAGAPGQQGR